MFAFKTKVIRAVLTNNEMKSLVKVPDNFLLKLWYLSNITILFINNCSRLFTIRITKAEAIYNA